MSKKISEQITVISKESVPVVISKESSTEKSHFTAQLSHSVPDSPVISTTERGPAPYAGRNPMFSIETPASPNKPKHSRVTNSDVFYKGKTYPEGSIVDFQDDHLNKYLVPIIDDDITKDDTVYDTALTPVSTDTSLGPKYVASRRRGRPRQL